MRARFSCGKELELYNVERVRGYLERNLGCLRKEVAAALDLDPRTVSKAIRIIRGKADAHAPLYLRRRVAAAL